VAPDRFDPRPIGVFDSGVGGLTVLSEIRRRLPDEATIYLGDNARAPYGPRPANEVQQFTLAAVAALLNADIKLLVIACNTATAQALPEVRSVANVPVIGVVRPGALAVSAATRSGHVGVLATAGTVASGAYPRAILEARADLVVHQQACPDLVPLVEAGTLDGADIEAAVEGYLGALRERDDEIDTLLLGCTHYPLLRQLIERVAGARVAIVDSAHTTAMAVEDLLDELRARAPAPDVRAPAPGERAPAPDVRAPAPDEPATHRIMTTGNVDAFNAVAERVFGAELPAVEQVSVEDLVPTASGGGSAIEAASVTRG
jgi:glutamate racemase